jgi:hypothetical protein
MKKDDNVLLLNITSHNDTQMLTNPLLVEGNHLPLGPALFLQNLILSCPVQHQEHQEQENRNTRGHIFINTNYSNHDVD